jgi:hypothetical protein
VAVAGRIPTLTNGEVGRGRQLGQHGEVVDSIEASRGGGGEWLTGEGSLRRLGGGAHRCWAGGAVGGTGAGPEERWHWSARQQGGVSPA